MAKNKKAEADEAQTKGTSGDGVSMDVPESKGLRKLPTGVFKWIAILAIFGLIAYWVRNWIIDEVKEAHRSDWGQAAQMETEWVVVSVRTIPLTSKPSEDLLASLTKGDRIEHTPFGARVEYSGIGKDGPFKVEQGPFGTPWFQLFENDANVLYCRIADSQPPGIVVSNPHLRVKILRQKITHRANR